jgi:Winged helix DNA-binding domain
VRTSSQAGRITHPRTIRRLQLRVRWPCCRRSTSTSSAAKNAESRWTISTPSASPRGGGVFRATIVHDGQVIGTWKASATQRQLKISAQPFAPLSAAAKRALDQAAARYGEFLGLARYSLPKMGY